jgi:hypothetical protein
VNPECKPLQCEPLQCESSPVAVLPNLKSVGTGFDFRRCQHFWRSPHTGVATVFTTNHLKSGIKPPTPVPPRVPPSVPAGGLDGSLRLPSGPVPTRSIWNRKSHIRKASGQFWTHTSTQARLRGPHIAPRGITIKIPEFAFLYAVESLGFLVGPSRPDRPPG